MLDKLMSKVRQRRISSDVRGDTIIEVLIAIGIVSLALTSAYAVTNRNAQASQKIQEQGQAQKLVEGQIELLRGYSGTIPANGCMLSGTTAGSGTACQGITAASSGAKYKLSINLAVDTYTVSATWDALGGQQGNVTMYYRR